MYTESHDEAKQQRVTDAIAPGDADGWRARKLSTLGAVLAFTSPGIPMIFMGQEFLEYRRWSDAAEDVPLDWGRVESCGGILALYRRLIHLRRNRDGNTRGLCGPNTRVFHINPDGGVLAFHRWDRGGPGDDVIVAGQSEEPPVRRLQRRPAPRRHLVPSFQQRLDRVLE